jgi:hypothetical protein
MDTKNDYIGLWSIGCTPAGFLATIPRAGVGYFTTLGWKLHLIRPPVMVVMLHKCDGEVSLAS